jgi:hypothetical protein
MGMKISRRPVKHPNAWGVALLSLALLTIGSYLMGGITSAGHLQADASGAEENTQIYLPVITSGYPLSIQGLVLDADAPVPGAVVRVQTTENAVTSDENGHFKLYGFETTTPVTLTAWASGYYISGEFNLSPGDRGVELNLTAHTDVDNPSYQWLSAFASAGAAGNCEKCHSDSSGHLPFDEWQLDAHSQTLENIRFMTMYNGTDVWGNQSPLTRFVCSPDYGCVPLPPDPSQPYYGPGYRLDFPNSSGNCAACHAPAAAIDQPYNVDPNQVSGVDAEGVPCDFCHKIWDVKLNQTTGLPNINMPGVISYEYRRPPDGHQYFAGPFDDVAPGEDTFSPLQNQSQFCAPCHFGHFWDVLVYNSFGEWLESPYSDPQTGQTCQDCHMPPGFIDRFALADQGGLARDPQKVFSHQMPGAMDTVLLQNALSMEVEAQREYGQLIVEITLTNDKTGHHVPTDSPLRHLILIVEALDTQENNLVFTSGPTLPVWCGEGDPSQGYFAGLPGKAYAKILEERWTNISPSGAYWNQTRVVEDNRIPALGSDSSVYYFEDIPGERIVVKARLLYRRAFITLVDQKDWDAPDIQMEAAEITLEVPTAFHIDK